MSEEEAVEAEGAPKKKKSKFIWVFLTLLILAGGGGAAYYYLVMQAPGEGEAIEGEEPEAPALYLELRPAFVVNLSAPDSARFVQAEVDLMARDQAVLDAVKKHMPAIRNNLLLIFASQRYAPLQTRQGKEALQKEVLNEINSILAAREGDLTVEEIYFTSFVMQ